MTVYEDQVHLIEINSSHEIVISKKKNGIQIIVAGNNYLVIEAGKDCELEPYSSQAGLAFIAKKRRAIPKEFK